MNVCATVMTSDVRDTERSSNDQIARDRLQSFTHEQTYRRHRLQNDKGLTNVKQTCSKEGRTRNHAGVY